MASISINNTKLYYQKYGEGAIPIIFVHGFLASSSMWREYIKISELPLYVAYTIDMRGHGRSHHVKNGCNLIQMADDVAHIITNLGLGKCILVGMSMGGAVGIQLALRHESLLRSLILISPGFGSPISGASRLISPLIPLIAQKRGLMRVMVKSALKKPYQPNLIQPLLEDGMLVSRETWQQYLHPSNIIHGFERLHNLRLPTLIIIGAKDKTIPIDKQISLAKIIPQARKIVFKEEGHGVVNENPDEVQKAILSFIE